jgi:molecular chaperone DnaJ
MMMPVAKHEYYEVLGVPKTASRDQIKAAYRRLAIEHHPDKNKGDRTSEAKFKEVNEAYEVLSDPKKRAEYDQYGRHEPSAEPDGTAYANGGSDVFREAPDFADFFRDPFGEEESDFGGFERSGFGAGQNLQADHTITLREAFTGTESKLRWGLPILCRACGGAGRADTCPECGGSGRQSGRRGFIQLSQTCARCGGTGRIGQHCTLCQGRGQVEEEKTVNVRIPAGVRDGTRLRVPLRDGSNDLYLVIRIQKDPRFDRDGDDLITECRISVPAAALGGEATVETLDKPVRIRIRAGTQSGTVLRVRGAGIPRLGGSGRGDLLVRLMVEVPTRLTKEQRKLFNDLADSLGETNSTRS